MEDVEDESITAIVTNPVTVRDGERRSNKWLKSRLQNGDMEVRELGKCMLCFT